MLTIITLFFAISASASESVLLAKNDHIESRILKERRFYSVYLPPSYSQNANETYNMICCLAHRHLFHIMTTQQYQVNLLPTYIQTN